MTDHAGDVALIQGIDGVPGILSICTRTTGMGFAAVARVTEERWVACAVHDGIAFGLEPGGELLLETTICDEIRQTGMAVVIDHVSASAAWRHHPVPRRYGFESYISVPIRLPDGTFWGTLCAIDPAPHVVDTPDTVATFALFADLLGFHVAAAAALTESEARLERERRDAAEREEFIGVLAHDLRNPIAAVQSGVRLLGREGTTERGRTLLDLLGTTASRMSGLVDEVLDFARGRLGGGIPTTLGPAQDLRPLVEQIVAEVRAVHPDRAIATDLARLGPVRCDPRRMGQALSNLLGKAIEAPPARPIRIHGASDADAVALSVEFAGEPLAPEALERLFEPFAAQRASETSLGLGLYIAAEIARAHGGRVTAASDAEGTRLTLLLPVAGRGAGGAAGTPEPPRRAVARA